MFTKKETNLSPLETQVLEMTNRRYTEALERRLVNPSDFDTNIICLKEFAECVNNFMTVAKTSLYKKI